MNFSVGALHVSQGGYFCIAVAVFFLISMVSYATWKGEHTSKRWTALGLGLAICVAGAFTQDFIAFATAVGSMYFIFKDAPVIEEPDDEEDDRPSVTRKKWDSDLSENERIVFAYKESLTHGVDAEGHLADPTPEFKKLAEEET